MAAKRPAWIVDAVTSARLAKIPQSRTKPEVAVRKAVHALGLRYRLNVRSLPGRPDLANIRGRWAIFVHGCYWHHHDGCARATVPKRNRRLWLAKFRANRARDYVAVAQLKRLGFRVLVVWECGVADYERLVAILVRFVQSFGNRDS